MRKLFLPLICAAVAAVSQNLLNNADFSDIRNGVPLDWKTNVSLNPDDAVTLLEKGGPNGENALRLRLEKMVTFGQAGLTLVAGEKYRLGMYIRTEGFTYSRGGISIANYGWMNETPNQRLPENTNGEWVKYEQEVECIQPAANEYRYGSKVYSVNIFATEAKGILDVASPYIIPLSEKAFHGSRRAHSFRDTPVVVPVSPMLDQIPAENAVIEFYCPQYETGKIWAGFVGMRKPSVKGELKDYRCTLTFPSLREGTAILSVEVYDAEGKTRLVTSDYPATVVKPMPPTPLKRLNNLVCDMFDEPAVDGVKPFVLADTKWLYISVDSGTVALDGNALPLELFNGRQEAMVLAEHGEHELTLSGNASGRLVVRTIPELFLHPFHLTRKPDYTKSQYDYVFMKKYLNPSFNTYNFNSTWHRIYDECLDGLTEVRKTTRRLIGSGGMAARKWDDPIAIRREIECCESNDELGGRTLDELHASSGFHRLNAVAEGLWAIRRLPARIYTWLEHGGAMCDPHYHINLISAQMNAGNGYGKFLAECYFRSVADEEEMQSELKKYRDYVAETAKFFPAYAKGLEMIGGGYQLPGGLCVVQSPECDPKASSDMFFNLCANDPAFMDLFGIGMYSFRSSDEEMTRWYAALCRHYGIEGRKEMLGAEYGYRLAPGHLANCDFQNGLDGWESSGKVEIETFDGYAKYQGRNWRTKLVVKDTAAVLTADKEHPATVSQAAVNLQPGKTYSLMYGVADRSLVVEKKACKEVEELVKLQLDNAEVIETQVVNQVAGGKAFTPYKVIFKPTTPSVKVTFTTVSPEEGSRSAVLNYIALRPFFDAGK